MKTYRVVSSLLSLVALAACGSSEEPSTDAPVVTSPPASDGHRASETPRTPSAPEQPAPPAAPQPVGSELVASTPAEASSCDRVYPRSLGVTGGRVYWQLDCWRSNGPESEIVASAPKGGGATTVIATWEHNLWTTVGAHVVLRRERHWPSEHYVSVVPSGTTTELVLPASDDCLDTASDAGHVYCIAGRGHYDETGIALKAWTIADASAGPTTVTTLGMDAAHLAHDGTKLYVGHTGSTWPQAPKQRTRFKRDGRIVSVDVATGAMSVVHEGVATTSLLASNGIVAWTDWIADIAENQVVPARAMLGGTGTAFETSPMLSDGEGWFRAHRLESTATETVLWVLATQATSDVVLAPNVVLRHFVPPAPKDVSSFAVDATHVYWTTTQGVFRRAK